MSEDFENRPFPRAPLYGAGALILFTLFLTGMARLGVIEKAADPEATAVLTRLLRFEDRPGGGIAIFDASTNQTIELVAPGKNGFMRIMLRSMARDRKKQGIGAGPPFRLTQWDDGRLSLEDTATGKRIGLHAFGALNAATFAGLLNPKPQAQTGALQ